jgi:MFS family permease
MKIKNIKQLEILKELKNFLILWSSQSLSQLGSSMTSYSLIVWAFEKQDSVLSISLLAICSLLPNILLSFLAGTFIDKWNKKLIMIIYPNEFY